MIKILSCVAVVGLLVASSSSVFARGGASSNSPAALFKSGSTNPAPVPTLSGPASYAPGQEMRFNNPSGPPSTGASVYSPNFLTRH
jgi:hypothetical protein